MMGSGDGKIGKKGTEALGGGVGTQETTGQVLAVCTSYKKGIRKQNVNQAKFIADH